MRELFQAARDLQTFCQTNGWSFCFIGGLAVWRWGKPRFTQDVDITLLAGFRGEDQIVDIFRASLDWPYIYSNLNPLAELKEAPELVTQLRALQTKWRKQSAE